VTLTFDLVTLKVVSESRVTWAIFVPILVFLGLSVLDLGPMYATDRRQTKASHCPRLLWARHNNVDAHRSEQGYSRRVRLFPGCISSWYGLKRFKANVTNFHILDVLETSQCVMM